MRTDPPPSRWNLPPADTADEHGVVGIGADLEPGTILAAYRRGMFPMPLFPDGPLAWWSPDPRGVLPLDRLRVSRSLRRSCRRYEVRVDTAFAAVVDACRDPRRDGGADSVLFSANVDPTEGDLKRADREAMERALAGTNVEIVSGSRAQSLEGAAAQTEVWWYLLWGVVAVLAGEQLLGWFFGRGRS